MGFKPMNKVVKRTLKFRVVRGGSRLGYPTGIGSTKRIDYMPAGRNPTIGFRLVKTK